MHAKLRYLSASVNRFSQAAALSPDEQTIAFGSHKFLAIWSVADGQGVTSTIPGHAGLVTCVQFAGRPNRIISGDDQGWLYLHEAQGSEWRTTTKVRAHIASISVLVEIDDTIVTGSSDSKVKIWRLPTSGIPEGMPSSTNENTVGGYGFRLTQELLVGKRFPLSAALASLPHTNSHILAIGMTHPTIKLYIEQDGYFVEATTLSGHEDWIKSLAFCSPEPDKDDSLLTLASASQDGTIRLWVVTPAQEQPEKASHGLDDQILDEFEASLAEVGGDESGRQISLKHHLIKVKESAGHRLFHVTFDALLIGHDAGVTSIAWQPSQSNRILLSTSVDSSVILWSPATFSGGEGHSMQLWTNQQRFGDVGGQRLGGFVGSLWINESQICAWGWNGGTRMWGKRNQWEEMQAITGHAGPVHGIHWEPEGRYIISASLDQTVRIHSSSPKLNGRWFELARAQTHGYDCIKAIFLSDLRMASISDEKVTRVFDAPRAFVHLAHNLGIRTEDENALARPAAANVPPLGLSNKALIEDAPAINDPLDRPRFEAELAAFTLWPEIEKIFGHGYESIALAVSHSRDLIATACKATSPEHAVVRLYDTERFKPFGPPLAGHTLTVTRIAFNRDDRFVLAVGKDRTWHLFERRTDGDGYTPLAAAKGHARVIWDCEWMHEQDIFATASRDKSVKLWSTSGDQIAKQKPIATIKLDQAATAVDFLPERQDGHILMAVGLESGGIQVYSAQRNALDHWSVVMIVPSSITHVDHVRSLSWSPKGAAHEEDYLASSGDDGSVRILEVKE